ncbi:hypothetical protein LXA43DRAFT_1019805 [Ganoderma leucocontextum]|nr:hypothetical protein LXA43DRAFT_1019805 [Ganoderma leucocontextum]
MLRSALRIHPQAPPLFVRQYVRNPPPLSPTVPTSPRREPYVLTPRSLLAIYRKRCTHPSLTFVPAPTSPPPGGLLPPGSSQPDFSEYSQWAHIASAPTLASALDHVDHVLSLLPVTPTSAPRPAPLPTWLLLAILCKPPATATEALAATTLALHHPHTSTDLSPLVLLLAAYWLANLRMYAPLRSLVLRLINYKHGLHDFHIALMLRILAQVHPANELQRMIALLLDLATRNHFDLGVRTYRAILENRAATGRVASRVEQHMKARGYSPNLSHSRAFVHIYGRTGKRKAASRYWRRIRLGQYYGPKAEYITAIRHQALLLEDTLRGGKRPKQITQYVKYLLKTAARAEADPTVRQCGHVPPFPGHMGIPKKVYMLALRVYANDAATSLHQLLNTFRLGLDSIGDGTKRLWCYFVTIKGLLKRSEYGEAAKLLGEIWDGRDKFSAPEVTIAVEALTMVGRPDAAFRLLLSLVPESDTLMAVAGHLEGDYVVLTPKTYVRAERTIDTQAVNSYMVSLLRIGRPDAVFFIWDTMRRVFRVEPDSVTLAIVLKAARYARKTEGALQVAIADFGLGRVLSLGNQTATQDWTTLGREEATEAFKALLVADGKRSGTAFWRGERAGVVALRTAWEVLTMNWPELKGFDPPCYAIRRSAGEQAVSPMSDLLHSFTSHSSDIAAAADSQDADVSPHLRMYFGIVPEDAMFRALFDLLAEEDRAAQIPLVLTWMRYLKVHPSRDTLATALVYWGEVTFEGPWIQRLRRGESQYVRLLKWITKWVGWGNVPRRDEMQKALMRVKWFRELDAFKVKSKDAMGDWSRF